MQVLLVSCYELGHQPLHLASPAAFLQQRGHAVRAVDLAVEPYTTLDEASAWADMVAVAVPMHTASRLATRAVERVRATRGDSVTVVVYGLYASLCHEALPVGAVDHWIGGEFEEELVQIASGEPSGREIVLDRLRFPVPVRDLLPPLERYAKLLHQGETRLAGYVETQRGCVHRCRHCPIPPVYDGRIRIVQKDTVLADIGRLRDMGARHITFGDPDFFNAVPHVLDIVQAMHDAYPELTFDVTTKVEHILEHADLLPRLREWGLLFVVSAVETLNDDVLRLLDKGHTAADARTAILMLRAHSVEPRPSFLPFTPWSGLGDYLQLLDFVAEEDLIEGVDPVQLSIRLLVPDGSLLLQLPEMQQHLDGYDALNLTWRWRHPDPAMDELQANVAALVAADTDSGKPPAATHHRIRHEAASAAAEADIYWDPRPRLPAGSGAGRPRLSEPWFC